MFKFEPNRKTALILSICVFAIIFVVWLLFTNFDDKSNEEDSLFKIIKDSFDKNNISQSFEENIGGIKDAWQELEKQSEKPSEEMFENKLESESAEESSDSNNENIEQIKYKIEEYQNKQEDHDQEIESRE